MSLPYILILYYSRHGSVAEMAKYIARGVKKQTAIDVKVRQVPDVATTTTSLSPSIPEEGVPYCTLDELAECSGLILGSPSYFGSIASPLKFFLDQTSTLWMTGKLIDKPASVFTSGSSMHGGHEMCLQALATPLFHHGMIIQSQSYKAKELMQTQTGGTPYGASHLASSTNNTELSNDESALCEIQGYRLAKLVMQLNK
ncbi:NAD(P)H:quinone oxidoreductase [Marinomonas sp. 15G1-11]|uniref:NAD(P)H:quinone oxidoreductase n=1 Tax=Marinomonas phaeophyticola TaxID=3004091 RepID=A0ABT4JYK4_9GAMM|nr:NAD(P)H:quinone oxidoreductase [Marinomonas sp. 15G1-11]MCZ2723490.1 NAD(P)H:quinone oxidoreductase [Marinomonas sp. 15G1-11]